MIRPSRTPLLKSSAVAVTAFLFLAAGVNPGYAAPTPGDDTPTLLTPKGEHEDGSDEAGFDKLRDAYYWSRLLAGDDAADPEPGRRAARERVGQGQRHQPATPRPRRRRRHVDPARARTRSCRSAAPPTPSRRSPGRIGALAIRKDGTIILGAAARAASGPTTRRRSTWTSRTKDTDTQSVGALAIAPSNDNVVYMGSGEGALVRRQLLRRRHLPLRRRRRHLDARVDDCSPARPVTAIAVDPTNAEPPLRLDGPRSRRRSTAPPRRPTQSVRRLRVQRRRRDLDAAQGHHQRAARRHRPGDGPAEPERPVRVVLGRRHLPVDRRRRDLDDGAWASLPAGNFLEGGTRFSLGISHPAGATHATLYTGLRLLRPARTSTTRARSTRRTDDGAHWTRDRRPAPGIDSIARLLRHAVLLRQRRQARPDQPERRLRARSRTATTTARSPAASSARPTAARPGRTSATTCTRTSTRSPSSRTTPQHVAIGNDGGVWQSHTGGGRNAAGDPLSAADWEDLNGQVDPSTAALIHSTGLAIAQFTEHRAPCRRRPGPVLGRHAGQRHAAQVARQQPLVRPGQR